MNNENNYIWLYQYECIFYIFLFLSRSFELVWQIYIIIIIHIRTKYNHFQFYWNYHSSLSLFDFATFGPPYHLCAQPQIKSFGVHFGELRM